MRACLAILLLSAVLAGCGASGSLHGDETTSADGISPSAAGRIDKCVDRLSSVSTANGASGRQVRRYATDTYCAPFEQNTWVYDDGALSIEAQRWLDRGRVCATASSIEPGRTGPCDQGSPGAGERDLDCALLHHVRRREALDYITQLQAHGGVRCDDGTPLTELGVP